jgi:hypothetical protein
MRLELTFKHFEEARQPGFVPVEVAVLGGEQVQRAHRHFRIVAALGAGQFILEGCESAPELFQIGAKIPPHHLHGSVLSLGCLQQCNTEASAIASAENSVHRDS